MKLADIRKLSNHMQYAESADTQAQVNELLISLGYDPYSIYQELEMSSSLVDTHRDVSYTNLQVQLHSHTFYELLYCRSSCGAEYLVGADRYRMQRGDVILVPPGVSHRPLLPDDMEEPYKRYVLWLSREFMEMFAAVYAPQVRDRMPDRTLLRMSGRQSEEIGELFRRGVEEAEAQLPGWEAAVLGNTMTLMTRIGRLMQENAVPVMQAETPELLDRVIAYIEEHLSERITLADTARQFFVSESTISQVFRKRMSVSFYRWVTQRRLIAAKTLIQSEDGEDLERIGRQVGFADYSTFYRAFRKEYGIGPHKFRKLQRKTEG